jgi:thiamine pyrophosphokinase
MGAEEITLTCAVSRQIDHVMENIRMMLFSPVPIRIEEPDMEILVVKEGESATVPEGRRVSVIPLGNVELTLTGFRYPFRGAIGQNSGVSNISENGATVSLTKGNAAVFIHREGGQKKTKGF